MRFFDQKIIATACLGIFLASCSSLFNPSIKASLKKARQSGFLKHEDKTRTIKGIDANHNGVRDYAEEYLKLKYAKHPEYADVYMGYAKELQNKFTLNSSDRELYRQSVHKVSLHMVCADKIGEKISPQNMYEETMIIYALSINTRERKNESKRISSMVSGMVFSLPSDEHCTN